MKKFTESLLSVRGTQNCSGSDSPPAALYSEAHLYWNICFSSYNGIHYKLHYHAWSSALVGSYNGSRYKSKMVQGHQEHLVKWGNNSYDPQNLFIEVG